jgi:ribosomal protein S27E
LNEGHIPKLRVARVALDRLQIRSLLTVRCEHCRQLRSCSFAHRQVGIECLGVVENMSELQLVRMPPFLPACAPAPPAPSPARPRSV